MTAPDNMTDVEFMELLQKLFQDCDNGVTAWRKFRTSSLDMNRLEGRNAGEREVALINLYDRWKEYPAHAVFELRQARLAGFYSDLGKAFGSTEGIQETDIEAWLRHSVEAKQHGKGAVKVALKELYKLRPTVSMGLWHRAATELWPDESYWIDPAGYAEADTAPENAS